MGNSPADWGKALAVLGAFALFYIILYVYSRIKRKFCEVPVPAGDHVVQDEKSPLLALTKGKDGADVERQTASVTSAVAARPWALILWTLLVLPLNVAVWYVLYHEWHIGDVDVDLGELTGKDIVDVCISVVALLPVIASVHVLGCSIALQRVIQPEKVQKTRLLMRMSMLDGVIIPLVLVVFILNAYPEKFAEGGPCTWAATAAYVSQKFVWKYFFSQSKRDSQVAL